MNTTTQRIPKENAYKCRECSHTVCTVDVDVGVTPFLIRCDKCDGGMESCFYPRAPRPPHIPPPSREWYMPKTAEELGRLSREDLRHVNRGGLLMRARTEAEPVYHDEEGAEVPQYPVEGLAHPEVMVLKNYHDGPTQTRPGTITRPPKPQRNQPCPCGSGNKYKHCCF